MSVIVTGNSILFARPIIHSPQINSNEVAMGTVAGTGFSMTSSGTEYGTHYEGKYTGTLIASGGTFVGTQSWTIGEGAPQTRSCAGAFMKSHA